MSIRILIYSLICAPFFSVHAKDLANATDNFEISQEILTQCLQDSQRDRAASYFALTNRPEGCSATSLESGDPGVLLLQQNEQKRTNQWFADLNQANATEVMTKYIRAQLVYGNAAFKPSDVSELCGTTSGMFTCTDEELRYFTALAAKILKELKAHPEVSRSLRPEVVVAKLNGRLQLLNQMLAKIDKKTIGIGGYFYSHQPELSEDVLEAHRDYYTACVDNLNAEHGFLLTGFYLGNKSGWCKLAEKDSQHGLKEDGQEFKFTRHALIGRDDITAAMEEFKNRTVFDFREEVRWHRWLLATKTEPSESVRVGMVRSTMERNYNALGEVLNQDPYQAGYVCKAIQSQEDSATSNRRLGYLTDVFLAASTVTGVGSIVAVSVGFVLKMTARAVIKKIGLPAFKASVKQILPQQLAKDVLAGKLFYLGNISAAASATLGSINLAPLATIYLTEQESLNRLRAIAMNLAFQSSLTLNEMNQVNDAQKTATAAGNRLLFNAVMLPLESLTLVMTASQLMKGIARADEAYVGLSRVFLVDDAQLVHKFIDGLAKLPMLERLSVLRQLSRMSSDDLVTALKSPVQARNVVPAVETAKGTVQGAGRAQAVSTVSTVSKLKKAAELVRSLKNLLLAKGLKPMEVLTVTRYMRIHEAKNPQFALELVGGLNPQRFRTSKDSSMVLAFAVRKMSDFYTHTTVSVARIREILNTSNDLMLSGWSFTINRVLDITRKIPNMSRSKAVDEILKADGASPNQIGALKQCLIH